MPRSANQKLKLLYLRDYLLAHTDEAHPATTKQLIDHLAANGIAAERKSVYDDLDALRTYGLDVEQTGDRRGWYLASRDFELPELKLLVDAVQSSKFITRRKSDALIRKLEGLCSEHEARALQRQVFVARRIKTMNESIYYIVDELHTGISEDRKLRFRYFEYTVQKTRRYRRDGRWYTVSPFALTWDNENYYLIGFDDETQSIRHFRVDRIERIELTDEKRDGGEAFKKLDMADYTRSVFGMFSGKPCSVRLRFANGLVGAVLDRLGQETMLIPDGDSHFTVTTDAVVSPQFFAWLCGFGADVKILAPDDVAAELRDYAEQIAALYRSR